MLLKTSLLNSSHLTLKAVNNELFFHYPGLLCVFVIYVIEPTHNSGHTPYVILTSRLILENIVTLPISRVGLRPGLMCWF